MASPGWYPDPAGQPGAFRFWDGGAWSSELTDNPYAPPPGQAAPSPPPPPPPAYPTVPGGYQSYAGSGAAPGAGPAPGGWPSAPQQPAYQPTPTQPSSSGRGLVIALVAIVAVIALGVGTFFVVEALTDDDSSSSSGREPTATDPTQDPSTDPSEPDPSDPEPSQPESSDPQPTAPPSGGATPTALQCTGGLPTDGVTGLDGRFLTGGGLRMPRVKGFSPEADQGPAFTFADGVVAPSKVIEQLDDGTGWVAVYALGALNKANGFDSPQQAAETVLACMTASEDFYDAYVATQMDDSAATTVAGADAWELTANVLIDDPQLSVSGDVAKVVVVDTGDPDTYGLFVSVVPIGDDELIAQQDEQVGRLRLQ